MNPQVQRLAPFKVAGLSARTSNRNEGDPQAARIGTLWTRFFDERIYDRLPQRSDDMRLFGVYSGYAGDAEGDYDITTGVAVSEAPEAVRIEGGDYLVFSGQGEMPQLVRDLWRAIWQWFDDHPEVQRRYRSDFEAYSAPDQVAIHIGVLLG
jgi:predicted transcriptional regulator YdeE